MGLGLALTLAGTAAAQQGDAPRRERGAERGGPGMRGRGGPDGLLLRDITLTEGQRAQIAQLGKTQRDGMQAQRAERQKQAGEVRAARERGDTAAVRAAMLKNRQAMEQARTQHLASIRAILTAGQQAQFDKNVAELQARMSERGERRPHVGQRGPRGGKGPARGGR